MSGYPPVAVVVLYSDRDDAPVMNAVMDLYQFAKRASPARSRHFARQD